MNQPKVKQPLMSPDRQQHVYEASKVVMDAIALSYEDRGGMTTGRAAVIRLMEAGWRPPKDRRGVVCRCEAIGMSRCPRHRSGGE